MGLRREITRRVILGSRPFSFCFFFSLFISVNMLITQGFGALFIHHSFSFLYPERFTVHIDNISPVGEPVDHGCS